MTAINEAAHQQRTASLIIGKINTGHELYFFEPVFKCTAVYKQCGCGIGHSSPGGKIGFQHMQIFGSVIYIVFVQQQVAEGKTAAWIILFRRFNHQLQQKYVRPINTHTLIKRSSKVCDSIGLPYICLSYSNIRKYH